MHGVFFKLIDFVAIAKGGVGVGTVPCTPCVRPLPLGKVPLCLVLLLCSVASVRRQLWCLARRLALLSFVLDLIIPPGDLHFVPCSVASFKSDGINQKQLAQGRRTPRHPSLPHTYLSVPLFFHSQHLAIKSNDAGIVKLRAFRVFYVSLGVVKVYTLTSLRYVSYCHFCPRLW